MPGRVRIVWDRTAIRALATDPDVARETHRASRDMARALASATPVRTGGGALSIAVRPSRARGADDVGWDKQHFYLIFPEYGTKFIDAQRFARRTLEHFIVT